MFVRQASSPLPLKYHIFIKNIGQRFGGKMDNMTSSLVQVYTGDIGMLD